MKFSVSRAVVGRVEKCWKTSECLNRERVSRKCVPKAPYFQRGVTTSEGGRRILFEISSRPRKRLCRAICQLRPSSPRSPFSPLCLSRGVVSPSLHRTLSTISLALDRLYTLVPSRSLRSSARARSLEGVLFAFKWQHFNLHAKSARRPPCHSPVRISI